jgi:hypothetical protein
MCAFGNATSAQVAAAAERFIAKMNEKDLLAAVRTSEETMSSNGRCSLAESILHSFRQRGESSDDVAEGAGTTVEAMAESEALALRALLDYAAGNPGLLKEALTDLIMARPELAAELAPALRDGIAERLAAR